MIKQYWHSIDRISAFFSSAGFQPFLTKVYGINMSKSLFSILFEHASMLVDSFNSLSHIHKNKIIKDTLKTYFGKVLHYPRLQL